MNIQFGEKLLNVSPSLAAQIGLEEAVLAQLVFELSHVCPVKQLENADWFYLAPERWPELIPFWNMTKINEVFKNLESLKIVQRQYNQNGQFLIRLVPNNAFHPGSERSARLNSQPTPNMKIDASNVSYQDPVARNTQQMNPARQRNQYHGDLPTFMIEKSQQFQSRQAIKTCITPQWIPDTNLLIPRLASENIPTEFAYEQLGNFIGKHLEQGTEAADWNSRFIQWVIRGWTMLSSQGTNMQSRVTQRQEQRDEVRRKIMDIHDTNW